MHEKRTTAYHLSWGQAYAILFCAFAGGLLAGSGAQQYFDGQPPREPKPQTVVVCRLVPVPLAIVQTHCRQPPARISREKLDILLQSAYRRGWLDGATVWLRPIVATPPASVRKKNPPAPRVERQPSTLIPPPPPAATGTTAPAAAHLRKSFGAGKERLSCRLPEARFHVRPIRCGTRRCHWRFLHPCRRWR